MKGDDGKMNDPPAVHIVDDDAAVRESLAALLISEGYRVVTHRHVEGFLSALRRTLPLCVIGDVHFPKLSGWHILEHFRANKIDRPVIMMSGRADDASRNRARRAGAIALLDKPIHKETLLAHLREALGTT